MDLKEEIAKVAYELFERDGRTHGKDKEHWLEAERIVEARRSLEVKKSVEKKAKEPLARKGTAKTGSEVRKNRQTSKVREKLEGARAKKTARPGRAK